LGGGILAVDIIETKEGLKVNEINAVPEFRNTEPATGVSVSSAIIDYCIKKIQKNGR
jgi:[lysine-biosynthesis-protein LysW]--L-2-aminoadipate ligase